MPAGYGFRSSILRYLCFTKSSFFENFWWRHCMWFVVWAPPIKNPGYAYGARHAWLPEVESRTQGSRPRPRTQKKSEAKAKDSLSEDRHSRGQGQECSRPRPRTKDTKRKCSPKKKKKKGLHKNFSGDLQKKKKKKVFTKIFQAISTKKRFPENFSTAPQNFNFPKNSAVLEPRTGQFSRTSSRPRTSSRTPPLMIAILITA